MVTQKQRRPQLAVCRRKYARLLKSFYTQHRFVAVSFLTLLEADVDDDDDNIFISNTVFAELCV